jgi:hypothetical protein
MPSLREADLPRPAATPCPFAAFHKSKPASICFGAEWTGRTASWVAAEAFVGPGVTIGEGAVLGARGCAFRDLEPWTVYAGNPARRLKLRKIRLFDDVDAKS